MPDDKVTKTEAKAEEKVEKTQVKAAEKVEKTEAKAAEKTERTEAKAEKKAAKAEEREPDMTTPTPPVPVEDPPLTPEQFNQREALQVELPNDVVLVEYDEDHEPYFVMPDGKHVKAVKK